MIIRLNGREFAGGPSVSNSPRAALDREYLLLHRDCDSQSGRVEIALDWLDCMRIAEAVFAGGPRFAAYMIWHYGSQMAIPGQHPRVPVGTGGR